MAKPGKKKTKEKSISKQAYDQAKHDRTIALAQARANGTALAAVLDLLLGLHYRDQETLRGTTDDDSVDDAVAPPMRPMGLQIDTEQWARAKLIEGFGMPDRSWGNPKDIALRELERHVESKLKTALCGNDFAWNTPEAKRAERLAKMLITSVFATDHLTLEVLAPHALQRAAAEKAAKQSAATAKKKTEKRTAKKTAAKKKTAKKATSAASTDAPATYRPSAAKKKTAKKAARHPPKKPSGSTGKKGGATTGAPKAAEQFGERVLERMRMQRGAAMSVESIATLMGVSRPTVLRALKSLKATKQVASQGGGRSTRWVLAAAPATTSPAPASSKPTQESRRPALSSPPPSAAPRSGPPPMVPVDEDLGDSEGLEG